MILRSTSVSGGSNAWRQERVFPKVMVTFGSKGADSLPIAERPQQFHPAGNGAQRKPNSFIFHKTPYGISTMI